MSADRVPNKLCPHRSSDAEASPSLPAPTPTPQPQPGAAFKNTLAADNSGAADHSHKEK